MKNEISKLYPSDLWSNFYDLTQIPRPSKHEAKVVEFIVGFGKSLGLEVLTDGVGNVIIRKPATPGYENRAGVIFQGHVDMVPQKNSDKVHNFETDPLQLQIVDGWVKATGTTLGADNGIGVAAAMAVLQSKTLEHGPVEALFTIDEESGMTGAFGLQPKLLQGSILMNLDSEDEGELYVGCAGGTNANMEFLYNEVEVPKGMVGFKLSLTGLKGGHSGLDIIRGRGNANKLIFRFIKFAVSQLGVRLASIDGGNMRNAIPREAFAIVAVPQREVEVFVQTVLEFEDIFKSEYGRVEPTLSFKAESCEVPSSLIFEMVQDDLINAIQACPNGVVRMSDEMPGLVETSTNLSIVHSENGKIKVQCLIRSSVDTAKDDVESTIESVFSLAGARVKFDGQYPGWKPNIDSPILKVMKETYQKMYNKVPDVKAIHAGLECGILGAIYPKWDMISFGPNIRFPHSPDEKVEIEGVGKFWDYLVESLKNVPLKQ